MRCSRVARRIDSRRQRTRLSARRSKRLGVEEEQNRMIWVMHSAGVYGQRERESIQGASRTLLLRDMLRDTVKDASLQAIVDGRIS